MTDLASMAGVRRAQASASPELAALVVALAEAPDPIPKAPIRAGAPTLATLREAQAGRAFLALDDAGRRAFRLERWAALEAPDAEVPLPDRLRLHTVIEALWADGGAYARTQLLEIIAAVPLRYGPWRAIKRIFKAAEARGDLEIFGAIAARLDVEFGRPGGRGDVRHATLGYLVRRAWRRLRRTAEQLPAAYPDAVVEVLRHYPEDANLRDTWLANHVFYHGTGEFSRGRFRFKKRPSTLLKYRAYPELWRRTPRPLFTLLEQAQHETARRFAADALRTDFRATLREVEPAWAARLVRVRSATVDQFVIWLLDNVPRFEQGAFKALGLHEAALALLDSPADAARAYAAAYLRSHARDLDVDRLVALVNNDHEGVRAAARDLLGDRDPRAEVGLDRWGRLLGTEHGHDLARAALQKHFGARELTPAWFRARLLSTRDGVPAFAAELLPRVHPDKTLGLGFYVDLLDAPELGRVAAKLAMEALERFKELPPPDALRRALVNPHTRKRARQWLVEGRIPPTTLGVEVLQSFGFEGTWAADPWVAALRASALPWARDCAFDPALSEIALRLLADVRTFTAEQVGFEWLLTLVQRDEPRYHEFATDYLTKAFVPGDFADRSAAEPAAAPAAAAEADLGGASFLFTGKLMTMTRSEAEKKVAAAGGAKAGAVTAKLDYLVIGDEGSPLYGAGRKGSKQLKAEQLIEGGAPLRIISETAFLKMLAGEVVAVDDDSVAAGCERLWSMVVAPDAPDAPLARFAVHYLRRHHPDICPIETDRYVDPGAEIPDSFLTFERVRGLLADPRPALRRLGLEFARWAFARWAVPMPEIVALCELPYAEVREFVAKALTADEHPEHKRYRVDPAVLTADAVYRFCESLDAETRALGMALIAAHPALAVPDELFRLTESPDDRVRGFVIRQLWALYRDAGVTRHWRSAMGEGPAPAPADPPAGDDALRDFLRRSLFALPPARPPRRKVGQLRPLPARKAKLALIEVVRDLACEDAAFARVALPTLRQFTRSLGQSERAACLVAVTRIQLAWPEVA